MAKPTETDISALLGEVAGENADAITEFLKSSISMETLKWAHCPTCKKKVQVDYPDFNGAHKLLSLWLDRGLGKQSSAGAKPAGQGHAAPDLGKPIDKMTAAEREAYAGLLVAQHPELKDKFTIIKEAAIAEAVAGTKETK